MSQGKEGHDAESEYFAREDREKKEKLAQTLAAERAEAERAERKALHANRCGKCGGVLAAELFRGVQIDVCGDCHSVLLDPGELETLAGEDRAGVVGTLASLFGARRKG